MKWQRVLLCVGVVTTMTCGLAASTSASTSKSAFRDGVYATKGFGPGYSEVSLLVAGNGTTLVGGQKGSGAVCTASPAFIALDPNELVSISTITIKLPHAVHISPSGTFSYSGNVTLTPEDTQTSMSFSEPITLTGRLTKGNLVKGKTIAVTGTFSAPAICEAATPRTYRGVWAPKTALN